MPCSVCKLDGHNKRTCPLLGTAPTKETKKKEIKKETLVCAEVNNQPKPEVLPVKFSKNEENNYKEAKFSIFCSPYEEYEWASTKTKECSKCKKTKTLTQYQFNTSGRDPFDRFGYRLRRPECKECQKNTLQTKKNAIKKTGVIDMTGKCYEICGKTERLVYDHDHSTSVFRGILCDSCNKGIGLCGETLDGLLKRVNYIAKAEGKKVVIVDL